MISAGIDKNQPSRNKVAMVRLNMSTALLFIVATFAGSMLPAHEEATASSKPWPDTLACMPTPMPDRIVLTWSGDPATSQSVTWRSRPSDRSALAQLQPATGGPVPETDTVILGHTELLETDLHVAAYHTVEFTGLEPDTAYAYRVGDGINWSEWLHFQTAAAGERSFSFIYVGDAQNKIRSQWSRLIREAFREAPRAAFTLHAGDLVDSANSDAEWEQWFTAPGWVNGTIPVVAAAGNHEHFNEPDPQVEGARIRRVSRHWRPQFAFPLNGPAGLEETCYYLDYQGARIIVLNSSAQYQQQADWLRDVLSHNPQRWTILAFHHPVLATAQQRARKEKDTPNRRQLFWKPVFDEFKVDLVLSGHDHTYARSGISNVPVGYPATQDVVNGTVYVVSVSGPKVYSVAEADWMARSGQGNQLYQVIQIDGDTLTYTSRTANNEVYDNFRLHKQPGTVNRLEELHPGD
jgi:3',5'-cyclic AMP phosphodiesterase CpdA